MPLVILALGIILLFFLIVKVKMNSFLSLLLVCVLLAFGEGLPLDKIFPTIQKGLGATLGGLTIVVGFGAILGKLMADSGGAQRIATTLINMFGRNNVRWAVCLTGFIVGIALFYEIGFVLLIPLIFTIAKSADIPLLEVGMPMVAALSVTHGFLPPHPGPTAISVLFNADIGLTLVYGILIGIPTVILAGPLLYNTVKDIKTDIPEGLHNDKVFTEEEMPSLMAATAIGKMMNLPKTSTIMVILNFIGDPSVALTISIIIAFYTFGFARGKSMKDIMATSEKAILTVAMILFVVGAGGALKQVLIDSGVGTYIGELVMQVNVSPLVLAWLIAVVIRIAVGSATVAAMTAGGIVAPLIPLTGVSPELMVIAVGAGSVFFSPPNDPGFWLFKEFFGLSVKQTLRSWCMVETVIAVCGLIGVEIINLFL